MKLHDRFAMLGLVLIAPSLIILICGLTGLNFPRAFGHPLVVLGGLLSALALNLFCILRLGTDRAPDGALDALTLRIRVLPANWAVVSLSLLLMISIAGYLFVENFQPRVIE